MHYHGPLLGYGRLERVRFADTYVTAPRTHVLLLHLICIAIASRHMENRCSLCQSRAGTTLERHNGMSSANCLHSSPISSSPSSLRTLSLVAPEFCIPHYSRVAYQISTRLLAFPTKAPEPGDGSLHIRGGEQTEGRKKSSHWSSRERARLLTAASLHDS